MIKLQSCNTAVQSPCCHNIHIDYIQNQWSPPLLSPNGWSVGCKQSVHKVDAFHTFIVSPLYMWLCWQQLMGCLWRGVLQRGQAYGYDRCLQHLPQHYQVILWQKLSYCNSIQSFIWQTLSSLCLMVRDVVLHHQFCCVSQFLMREHLFQTMSPKIFVKDTGFSPLCPIMLALFFLRTGGSSV